MYDIVLDTQTLKGFESGTLFDDLIVMLDKCSFEDDNYLLGYPQPNYPPPLPRTTVPLKSIESTIYFNYP